MSDVFISYARSTAKQAQAAATALRNLGYSVWLDDELLAHRTYARVIEEQLAAAKAALVIWSADAVNSEWVLSEANRAREGEKLVQVVIERVRLPMPFDQIQCAELTGWTGNIEAPGWRKVAASIAELTAAAGGRRATPASTAARQAEPRVAVLAFDNLSGDPDLVYFSDGVSEEIQQTVVRTTSLKVIGRGSSFQFRGADKAAAHVGGALNATHVLDGSVRRSGQKVRIGAQLIECATETTLWSDRFDRDLSDIFAVQDEIAAAVAAALEIAFAPPAAPRSVDPAAYDLYLRARTTGSHAAAIELFEQAITLEPNFAQAWALLAGVRAMRLRYEARDAPYEVARAEVVHAAETALRLDPAAGAAYQALSWLEPFGCYQAREALGARALAVAPNDPVVLNRAGFFSAEVGRIGEALEYARRAHELDPLSPSAANNYACSLEAQGQYDKACELWDMICARWPDSEGLVGNAIGGAGVEGDWARIDKIVSNLNERGFFTEEIRNEIRDGRRMADQDPKYRNDVLERARDELARTGTLPVSSLATLYRIGFTEEAFDLVEAASFALMFDPQRVWPTGGTAGVSVIFNHSRSERMMLDPRFPRLCAKLGLCDYWVNSNKWPDCVKAVARHYDFKAECSRLVAL